MDQQIQIIYICFSFILFSFLPSEDKWRYSADLMEADIINNVKVQRLNKNVKFIKENKMLITDNAIQYVTDDVLHLNGNTMMINNMDTLTCDSMIYWSKIDSIYAIGNIKFVHGSKRGLMGDEMTIQYADSLVETIRIYNNAFAYNNLNSQIIENGPYLFFRDEMASKNMIAYFDKKYISRLELFTMANSSYHVIDDNLIAGNNTTSSDSIFINFKEGNIKRLQAKGAAIGEFNPENNNTKIDTTIYYGAEYIDYHIDDQLTFLSHNAYMEYQNTKLSAGKIIADWKTNILDAFLINDEYPTVETKGDAPMKGKSMVFDLVQKHGRIISGKTSFDDGIYHGKEVFRDDPNVFHVNQSKYTSCDLDNPHFYLGSKQMKLLPKDRIVAKPLWLHIYDLPIIGLPLAVFPNKGGSRHSGWIMPSFDSYKSIGTGFRNLGYYWAPNDYIDQKILINFFDEEGFHINSYLKYKKRNGPKWYNFQYNGTLNGTIKRRLNNNEEILNLSDEKFIREDQRLIWNHNQKLDPTQRLAIKYEFVSNKDAYQNSQEVSLQNRLKQNLASSLNYSKNWKSSSFSIGVNSFRDLSIENSAPNIVGYLNDDRYKSYKYFEGPKLNFRTGNIKIFGIGDKWYNSLSSSYSMQASMGRKDYWLIKTNDSTWAKDDTIKLKHGGIKHSFRLSSPQTFFNWLILNPSLSIREDWIFNYVEYQSNQNINKDGFKRRLIWNASISTKTKIYGLFPIKIGKLNAIRHVVSPSIRYQYQPDFSEKKWGGHLYFHNNKYDYFKGSYAGSTPTNEKQTYILSINNDFQAKIKGKKDNYKKSNFLTWNSTISFDALKDSLNFSEITSSLRVRNLLGSELFNIRMSHSIYKYDKINQNTINEILNIVKGEKPRLTRMDISTNMKIKLFGSKSKNIFQTSGNDTTEDIEDEFYFSEKEITKRKPNKNLWETKLQFRYSTNWKYSDENWDYKFNLKTTNIIKLSKKWKLSYMADFNLKEREMTYHSLRVYRPLHCWEFSFNYWPRGGSAGFSLQINVKNPELKDIKLTSKSSNRGFGGY